MPARALVELEAVSVADSARGEWRDAKYWAEQITVLEAEPCQYAPVAHEVL
ncbi:hypothetical protein SHJG_1474 [Streptomyces hygroscopicus subsp. jinggangensis 5008]|nr:hypothetical protein SHJG_1474 [Streptomyces hygroscopicus subsp. jinggangensis 5008]AGF60971.1 hypothetical protein SHJGH_1305 [Streptomyces hygroscopicus subsp. jinggangensis TL01]